VVEVRDGSPAAAAGLQTGDIITRIGNQSLTAALPNANRERTATRGDDPAVQRMMSLAQEWEPGESVQVEYLRGSDRRTVTVTTEEVPAEERLMTRVFGTDGGNLRLMEPFRFDGMLDSVRTFRFRADSIGDRIPGLLFRADSLANRARSRVVNIGRGCGGTMVLGFGDSSCIDGVQMVELNAQLGEYFGATRGVLVTEAPDNSPLGLRSGDVILSIGGRDVTDPMAAVRMLSSYAANEDVPLRVMRKNQTIEVRGLRPR
jgi:C-terminal processing protease CtpA/Prc